MTEAAAVMWESVTEGCERLRVPGGWLYRTWTWHKDGAALAFVPDVSAPPSTDLDLDEPACPKCNESRTEKIEDTSSSDAPLRRTCLSCGESWRLQLLEVNANGE